VAVLVDLQHIAVRRVDRVLFEDLSLTVSDGDRIGVVGINGSGKSTLLRLAAGVDPTDEGRVLRGRGTRVGFLEQVPELAPGSVRSAVGTGWEAESALERLGMGDHLDVDVSTLSGGQAKRVALARVLARPAELLVLDEPTNHLDLAAVAWLRRRLTAWSGGLLLVTHDRHLLDGVTTRMVELDRGRSYVHDAGYGSYLEARAERDERSASAEATRRNLARRELAWLRRGAQARSRKPQARIDAARRLIETRPEAPDRSTELELAEDTPRLGDKVIVCRGIAFEYAPGVPVLQSVDLVLGRRERLGVVGANGSGKSTLIDVVAGRLEPTSGQIETGPTVVVGVYDQQGVELDFTARVQDVVAGPHRSPGSLADVALMKRFWFGGELPFARVGTLSGGERRRLQLLVVLAARPNVLLLDEPTNDLDLDTLRILEDFLEGWPGALVVVSHDRTFLERTTERLVSVEADGSVVAVAGGVDGWVGHLEGAEVRGGAHGGGLRSARPGYSHEGPTPVSGGTPVAARPPRQGPGGPTLGRLLRDTEKEMVRRQRQRDRITDALTTTSDHQELTRLGGELAEAQRALDEVEERWLSLAEEAESRG
jgi:ATP-binding cassette subfamily F protein uup